MALPLPSYPPVHTHSTTPVSLTTARSLIDRYLTRSQTQPHLHPDAQLTPAGAAFSASSGPSGNLTLSSLRRIARGLHGENLAATAEELDELRATLGGERRAAPRGDAASAALREIGNSRDRGLVGPDGTVRRGVLKKIGAMGESAGADEERRRREELNAGDDEGWQEPEDFAESQEVLEGEVGEREGAPVVRQGEEVEENPERLESARVLEQQSGEKRKLSEREREDRKAAKKQRRKAEKRQKHEAGEAAAAAA